MLDLGVGFKSRISNSGFGVKSLSFTGLGSRCVGFTSRVWNSGSGVKSLGFLV